MPQGTRPLVAARHLRAMQSRATAVGHRGGYFPSRVDVILLILWHLWKARNAMIFDHVDSTPTAILIRITKDIDTWSCRYKKCCSDLEKWRDWVVFCSSF